MLFVWSNAVAVLLAGRLATRALPTGPSRLVGSTVLYGAICVLTLFVCGVMGQLNAVGAASVVTALFATEWLTLGALPKSDAIAMRKAELLALAGLATAATVWGGIALGGATYAWDDLTYHAAVPAWWVQSGSLGVPPLTYQAYYPMNSEMLSLWFMLDGSDTHIRMGVVLWAAMTATAGVAIGHINGRNVAGGALAMTVFLATPRVWEIGQSTSAPDLAVAGLGLSALALAWSPGSRSPLPTAALCGVAVGLALGAKVSMAPIALLLAMWWVLESRRIDDFRALWIFAAAVVMFGGWWYLRNLGLTGNPIFPAAFGPFAGPMDAAAQRETSLLGVLMRPERYPGALSKILYWRLDWPAPLGVLSAVGYLSGLIAMRRAWRFDRRHAHWLLLLVSSGLLFVAIFVVAPYSGTTNQPDYALHKMVRYLTLPFALGLALLPAALPPVRQTGALLKPVPRTLGIAVLLVVLFGIASRGPAKAAANSESLFAWDNKKRPIGQAWAALEDLPDGSRIATMTVLPGSHAFLYPLFGRRFQHTPVSVLPDGSARGFLHEEWRQRDGWWWEFEHEPKTERLIANLRAIGVDYIIVSKWSKSEAWPPQRKSLKDHLGSKAIVYQDKYSEIWKVNR